MTLFLPKDTDAAHEAESRQLRFEQMMEAQGELKALIEEFENLSGLGSEEKEQLD